MEEKGNKNENENENDDKILVFCNHLNLNGSASYKMRTI